MASASAPFCIKHLAARERTRENLAKCVKHDPMQIVWMTEREQALYPEIVEAALRDEPMYYCFVKTDHARYAKLVQHQKPNLSVLMPRALRVEYPAYAYHYDRKRSLAVLHQEDPVKLIVAGSEDEQRRASGRIQAYLATNDGFSKVAALKEPTFRDYEAAFRGSPLALAAIPGRFQSQRMAIDAVRKHAYLLPYVAHASLAVLEALFAAHSVADVAKYCPLDFSWELVDLQGRTRSRPRSPRCARSCKSGPPPRPPPSPSTPRSFARSRPPRSSRPSRSTA